MNEPHQLRCDKNHSRADPDHALRPNPIIQKEDRLLSHESPRKYRTNWHGWGRARGASAIRCQQSRPPTLCRWRQTLTVGVSDTAQLLSPVTPVFALRASSGKQGHGDRCNETQMRPGTSGRILPWPPRRGGRRAAFPRPEGGMTVSQRAARLFLAAEYGAECRPYGGSKPGSSRTR